MEFKYIGDEYAPEETTVYGIKFVKGGEAVKVSDEKIIQKLTGIKGFVKFVKAVKSKKTAAKTKKTEIAQKRAKTRKKLTGATSEKPEDVGKAIKEAFEN